MEVESALVRIQGAEAAVVAPRRAEGPGHIAFVTLESATSQRGAESELRKWVSKEIGSLARLTIFALPSPAKPLR